MASATVEASAIDQAEVVDGDHYEVVRGTRVETPRLGAYESWIASVLDQALGAFIKGAGLGRVMTEMLFLLDPAKGLQRRPDVAFVSFERWARERRIPRMAAWGVVPDLAVEVVSPRDLAQEVVAKVGEYFRAGVRAVWFVYPIEAQMHVWESPAGCRVRGRGDDLEGGAAVPGFRLPLAELFEPEQEAGGPEGSAQAGDRAGNFGNRD